MIKQISIPPAAKEAAMETTEEMRAAAKEALTAGREALSSFYSQVSCTDLSAVQALQGIDCNPIKGRDAEGAVTLDWRADPFVSMSDLTLVVYDGTRGIPYYVHTLLLAYGGRKSGFVAEQIKSQQKKAHGDRKKSNSRLSNSQRSLLRTNSSRSKDSEGSNKSDAEYKVDIYVPALAARRVPTFLDYVYGSKLELATATAPPLRYLANRFDCRDLHREVSSKFIPRDLELNTAPQYCVMADELKDFELRDKSIRIMAERFEKLNVKSIKGMHPRLVRSLVQDERLECGSETLSEKVAEYLRLRDGLREEQSGVKEGEQLGAQSKQEENEGSKGIAPLTDEDYYWLTHCAHMPKISPKEALFYFNYGARYPQVMNEIGSGSLKARCLAACSDDWALDQLTLHLENSAGNPMELYESLEPKMKVQLLESSLVGARRTMAEKGKEFGCRNERDRDVKLSEQIMYKNSKDCPSKVVVLGCGVAPANGLYLSKVNDATSDASGGRGGANDGAYEKEAVWKQQRVTFVLHPATSGQYYTQYKLGVRHGDGPATANNRTRVLYNSPTVMGASGEVIPEQAWEVEEDDDGEEGLHPPPQFVGRVDRPEESGWNKNSIRSVP